MPMYRVSMEENQIESGFFQETLAPVLKVGASAHVSGRAPDLGIRRRLLV